MIRDEDLDELFEDTAIPIPKSGASIVTSTATHGETTCEGAYHGHETLPHQVPGAVREDCSEEACGRTWPSRPQPLRRRVEAKNRPISA